MVGAVVTFIDVTQRREVDRLKNEFVSTVSHELRTPLTSIMGALGLIQGQVVSDLPEKLKRMLKDNPKSKNKVATPTEDPNAVQW